MLARKYRRQSKTWSGFEKRFGWSPEHVATILDPDIPRLSDYAPAYAAFLGVVKRNPGITESELVKENRWAKEAIKHQKQYGSFEQVVKQKAQAYIHFFRRFPQRTHLFPARGTYFQFWFAKGIRDALGSKVRLRTIVLNAREEGASVHKPLPQQFLQQEVQKLGIGREGVVVHDAVHSGRTIKRLKKAISSGVHVHRLPLAAVEFGAEVPVFNRPTGIHVVGTIQKKVDLKRRKLDLRSPNPESRVTTKEAEFVRRALYGAGFAITSEILAEEAKKAPKK